MLLNGFITMPSSNKLCAFASRPSRITYRYARWTYGFATTWRVRARARTPQVWPIYDTVLYAYVPTVLRPLFNSFMSILWGGYLSHVSQPHEEEKTADDDNPDAPE